MMGGFTNMRTKLGQIEMLRGVRDLWFYRNVRVATGYEYYFYTRNGLLPFDSYTRQKSDLVACDLRKCVQQKSVLDLGSALGYYAVLAGLSGAKSVLGIDLDRGSVARAAKVARYMSLHQVQFAVQSIYGLDQSYQRDVVLAFAIVHWFIDPQRRPQFDSYQPIIGYLSSLASKHLFIEYVDAHDPTFLERPQPAREALGLERFDRHSFVAALAQHFAEVRSLGNSRPTREVFLASR